MKFELGPGLKCDLQKLIDTRALIQANSGGGKSWILRRLLEQTHGKVQHIVIDPEGEFASLRERFDYVLAAKSGGEAAADPRAAKLLAERLLELRVSAILDIYELHAHQRIQFVRYFLEAMVDAPKTLWHPALVVVDEAHVFCPQQGEAESAAAVIDLATRGRKRGFSAILATQRLSKLHKDAAAELNNKLIGRTGLDVDRKRAGEELGFTTKEQLLALRQLEPGHFYAFGPALSLEVVEVQVGPVQTTHPKAGSRIAFTPPPPTEAIKALLPQLADLPAEAEQKAKSEADLRKELAAARATITRLERAAPTTVETKTETKIERVEVPILKDKQVGALERVAAGLDKITGRNTEIAQSVREIAEGIRTMVLAAGNTARDLARSYSPVQTTAKPAARPEPPRPRVAIARTGGWDPLDPRKPDPTLDDGSLSGPAQRILDALAELEALGATSPTRELVCFLAGYAHLNSKGFANAIGALRSNEQVLYTGDGRVQLTDDGRARARVPIAPATPHELHDRLLAKLGTTAGRILTPLLEAYPNSIAKDELLAASGYAHANSKGFANNLGRLRTLGFVEYPQQGHVRAAPVLFLEGA